ncbi:type II secretion system F family protein [Herbaspirillum sp. HC18]|nr:type II secretion system F family protein [Herbaspirillum sp. HC18]
MTITSILTLAAIFVAVFGCSLLAIGAAMPNKAAQRLKSLSEGDSPARPAPATEWVAKIAKLSGPLAKLSIPDEAWRGSALKQRFMQAGFRHGEAQTIYFASKTILAAGLPALLWLLATAMGSKLPATLLLLCLLVAATAGFYMPNGILNAIIRRRQREIFEALPDALDLMTICIEAGLNIDASIARVAQEISLTSLVLAEELHLVTLELRAGNSREKALRNLALRTGQYDVDTLATMLIQADQFGTSIGDSLRVHSDHLRTRRRQQAEEAAAKVALKLLMPLIFCIFPALIVIMLGPSFIQIGRTLLPSLAGQ